MRLLNTSFFLKGTLKHVASVQRGDLIALPDSSSSEVVCVVKTNCANARAALVLLGSGLLITPYHPVYVQGQWVFPYNLGIVKEYPCPAVYSFVLNRGHVAIINDIECVTLGIYIYICVCVYIYVSMYIYIYIYIYICFYVYIYICMYVCVCIFLWVKCMFVCMHVCIYIWL